MAFKDRLKEARLNRGLTQEQIAEKIGVAKSTFTGYEKGNSEPSMYTISQIMNVLKVDANFLWQDEMDALGGNPMQVKYPEMKLIEKYRSLDPYGQETVNIVLDREVSRTQQLQDAKAPASAVIDIQTYHDPSRRITEYFHSASAGGGIFILGNEAVSQIRVSESDWDDRTDFVISVSGDSMIPDYMDGDKVLVSQRQEMSHGDVGIFVVNGKAYIKEYGETELISRNPAAENIKISEYDNIVCMGKVIGKMTDDFEIINE